MQDLIRDLPVIIRQDQIKKIMADSTTKNNCDVKIGSTLEKYEITAKDPCSEISSTAKRPVWSEKNKIPVKRMQRRQIALNTGEILRKAKNYERPGDRETVKKLKQLE